MNRYLCVGLLALIGVPAFAADDSITYEAKPGPGNGKHLVFLCGDEEYRGEEGLPMLAKILSQRHGFKCTVLFSVDSDGTINPDKSASLSNPAALDSADGIIMMLRFRAYPDDVMKHFVDAYLRGIPIIGLRTSTHAFSYRDNKTAYKDYNNFGRNVLGENWVSHWGANRQGLTKGIIEPGADKHPLMKGVSDIIGDTGVYETHPVADSTILVRGQVLKGMKANDPPAEYKKKRAKDGKEQLVNEPMMPVAWARIHKNPAGKENHVLCTTMGSATDLQSEDLRRLIVNGVYWGFGMPVPDKADVTYVDDYQPAAYGFKTYRKGIRPADHAIGKVLPAGTGAKK